MSLSLLTAPTLYPLTVNDLRQWCRIDASAGEPAPEAPTIALVTIGTGTVTAGAHRVLWTHKTADGETNAGAASAAVTADGTHTKITSTVPAGGSTVTAWVCYMTAAGGSTYKKVAELSAYVTSYTIDVADASLGAEAPSTNTTTDPTLNLLIQAVVSRYESVTGRACLTQTWEWEFDEFPEYDWLEVPKPPLVSVSSVSYKDTAGTTQTWAASNYVVDTPAGPRCRRGRIAQAYNVTWPSTYGQVNDIKVTFVCGEASANAVDPLVKTAMLMDASKLYEYRSDIITGTIVAEMPGGVKDIYRRYVSHPTQRAL